MSKVLVVDDEASICWAFRQFLTDDGHEVSVASSAEEAMTQAQSFAPDAIVLDVRLPGQDGISALAALRDAGGNIPVIVMTAFGDLQTAVRAVAAGAFDYLVKPFNLDQARNAVARALESEHVKDPRTASAAKAAPRTARGDGLLGTSQAMQEVFKRIALVAPTDVPVLITGESGVGKELVARAIHENGSRRGGPFVPVCPPALGQGVIESELFGHAKGSFTGASANRKGLLELASGGTVLLDEIGDVDLSIQVKLLRAIERREVAPVGDGRPRHADFRVIAATHRNLRERIDEGLFREDLYFRLSAFPIHVPPLRDRKEDLPALAERFLEGFAGDARTAFSPGFLEELANRPWWGNVRELRNAVEHAAILARGGRLLPEHLPSPAPQNASAGAGSIEDRIAGLVASWSESSARVRGDSADLYERLLAIVEPALLKKTLELKNGNRAAAAALLGLHRATLRQKLKNRRIDDRE